MNSMTGFGKCEVSAENRKIRMDIKTVNHRFLDISIRAPYFLGEFEADIRQCVKDRLGRGRVEITVQYASHAQEGGTLVNFSLVSSYLTAVKQICEVFPVHNDIGVSQLMALPDVVAMQPGEDDAAVIRGLIIEAARGALDELQTARAAEGEGLARDMLARLDLLSEAAALIDAREEAVVENYRARLHARIAELTGSLPVNTERLEQEVAVFADRCNVTEEVVRIKSHIGQFRSVATEDGPVGKKLDFICQELNREFNTIGSKAQDADITSQVIAAKAEVEKIREQVQNIE